MPSRTMRDAASRAALTARLARLTPDARPAWGRMSATQMLAHINASFEMAFGERPVAMLNMPLARNPVVRYLALHVIPFPKNAPTSPEILPGTPQEFETERARLLVQLERMDRGVTGIRFGSHPIFGALNPEQWGVLGYKHFDHHLRQFGV